MNDASILPPIAALDDPERRAAAVDLDRLFRAVTGWQPKLWQNNRIIGYGQYHYRYASGREGDFLATGFAIGKREFSLHILHGYSHGFEEIAERLGPHRRGRSCWYFRNPAAVDPDALSDLIRAGLADLARHAEITPT